MERYEWVAREENLYRSAIIFFIVYERLLFLFITHLYYMHESMPHKTKNISTDKKGETYYESVNKLREQIKNANALNTAVIVRHSHHCEGRHH